MTTKQFPSCAMTNEAREAWTRLADLLAKNALFFGSISFSLFVLAATARALPF